MGTAITVAEWAAAHADRKVEELAGLLPYDVQERCKVYARKSLDGGDMMERVKACAYERGLPLWEVHNVLGVVLRDAVLARML